MQPLNVYDFLLSCSCDGGSGKRGVKLLTHTSSMISSKTILFEEVCSKDFLVADLNIEQQPTITVLLIL